MEKIAELEERIKALEANQIAVIMTQNADINIYRSVERALLTRSFVVGQTTPASSISSALLSVNSITKGFLPPRMTAAQKAAITNKVTGLVVYQIDSPVGLYVYDGSNWSTNEVLLTFSTPLSRTGNTVSIPAATGSVNGYLASADWTTFNNKLSTVSIGTTLTGNGTGGSPLGINFNSANFWTAAQSFLSTVSFSGTTNPGLIVSNLTTTQRDALTATAGTIIFNTTTSKLNVYSGVAWEAVTSV